MAAISSPTAARPLGACRAHRVAIAHGTHRGQRSSAVCPRNQGHGAGQRTTSGALAVDTLSEVEEERKALVLQDGGHHGLGE